MTLEEAKRAIYKASKDDTSSPKDCIHLLCLHKLLEQIYDEHEAELKQAYIDVSNSNNELIKSLHKQIKLKNAHIEKITKMLKEKKIKIF